VTEFSPLLNLVSTIAIVAGLVFAGIQVELARQQRKRDSSIQLMQSFRTPEIVAGIAALIELPSGLSKAELQAQFGEKLNDVLLMLLSLESVGILVQKRDIPIDLAEDFFFAPTVVGWQKLKRYIEDLRREMQVDTPLEYFQFLAEQMIRRQNSRPSPPAYIAHRDWTP
jgi:hypothetical protein